MKTYTKALLAGMLTVAVAKAASAQVQFGIFAGDSQPYYPPMVQAQPTYVVPPGYYRDQDSDIGPDWRMRHEWRERQEREWRREQWQRQQEWRRREEWRRHEEWEHHQQWRREYEHRWDDED